MVRYAGEWAAYFATAALRWRLSSSSSSGGGGSGLASLPALSVRAHAGRYLASRSLTASRTCAVVQRSHRERRRARAVGQAAGASPSP